MASQPPDNYAEKRGCDSTENSQLADITYDTVPKPFRQTHFGRLPPEIREKIFIELLATPPSYAGHRFARMSTDAKISPAAPKKFVQIKASWYQVTRTCRQVYMESRSLFFASKSYYLANSQELTCFLGYDQISWRPIFQWDIITALCLKDLVKCSKLYTKEQIENIFSDPTDFRSVYNTRQELEAMTFKTLDISLCYSLSDLNSLRTVGLCIRVGEEMLYVNFLYYLSSIRRGLVEFVDASHWLIRPQNPEDVWRIQYSCFTYGDFAKGKDNEEIPYDRRSIELEVTDIDSRAPGLQEGDERYIEVQLQVAANQQPLQELVGRDENDIGWELASDYSDVDLFSRDSHQAQLEIPQDQVVDNALAEASEDDHIFVGLEPDSNWTDHSSFLESLWLQSENSHGPQSNTDIDHEEDPILLGPASEEASGTQPKIRSNHQAEDPPLSVSFVSVTHNAPTNTENDRMFLNDTDEEDDHVQTDTKASDRAPQVADLQHNKEFHFESATETNQIQKNLENKVKGGSRLTNTKYLSRQKKQPLLDALDTPNPYTEEEMESYENWQQLAIARNQEQNVKNPHQEEKPCSSFRKRQEHHVEGLGEASKTATPTEKFPSPASPNRSGLSSKSVQIGALFLLFSLFVITGLHPEWLSNERRDRKGSSQQ